jgi:hypothetical protein
LLETVPESVTASPKMLSVRDADSETEREFGVTVTVPAKPVELGSVYAKVPAVGKSARPAPRGVEGELARAPGDIHPVTDRVGVRPVDGIAALHRHVAGLNPVLAICTGAEPASAVDPIARTATTVAATTIFVILRPPFGGFQRVPTLPA